MPTPIYDKLCIDFGIDPIRDAAGSASLRRLAEMLTGAIPEKFGTAFA